MPTRKKKPLTRWHRLLAKMFEELLTPLNITVISDFKIMSSPPEADILLIRRNSLNWTAEQRTRLPDGIRDAAADHILIEFKYTESVNKNAFTQASSYDYFYKKAQKNLNPNRIQTFVISSQTPSQDTRARFGYTIPIKPGVYQNTNSMLDHIHLIVINELSNAPHNDFIKCFSSRSRIFRASFKKLLETQRSWISVGVYYLITGLLNIILQKQKEEFIMNQEFTPKLVMDMGRDIYEALLTGLRPEDFLARFKPDEILSRFNSDEILSRFKPEERVAGLKPEERIAGLKPEERIAGLKPDEILSRFKPEERIAGLKPEEIVNVLSPEVIEELKKYLNR